DAVIGELIRRQALGIERAKAGFVSEEWATGHGHTALEQDIDRRIEPEYGDAGVAHELRAAGLGVSAAAESEDGAFFLFSGAAESSAELVRFELAESEFAVTLEELRDGDACCFFDAIVEIDKAPSELACEQRADGGFAGTHEAGESEDRETSGH